MKNSIVFLILILFATKRVCIGQTTSRPPAPGDLRINEILFDPYSGGKDFVELLNVADYPIQLQGLVLFNQAKAGYSTRESTVKKPFILFPHQYVALTPDTADLRRRYPLPDSAVLFPNTLPTLDPDKGNISLIFNNQVLESFQYSAGFHHPLLRNRRGVSLERLSAKLNVNDPNNWHSAAGYAGYATPGMQNSQVVGSPHKENLFKLPEATFSPDGDGYQDVLLLQYTSDLPGYLVNIRIFDAQGRSVCTLVSRDLLGSMGSYAWDGRDATNAFVPVGIYLIRIEYVHPHHNREPQILACIRATTF